jgi:PAT family beta-lactamase induction signal transducer AmpG
LPEAHEEKPATSRQAAGVSPHLWVPSTYFAEGYPYAIVNNLAEILFQQAGASLGVIGMTSLLHAPWNLKFLWANWVDAVETKRRWMIAAQLVCAALLFGLAGMPIEVATLPWLAALFLALAVASATNDIAIDAYYMEALGDAEQAKFVGYRATAYKLATLLVKGPLQGLIATVGFAWGFSAMGLILLATAGFHLWLLPEAAPSKARVLSGPRRRLFGVWGLAAAALLVAWLSWDSILALGRWLGSASLPLTFWVGIGLVLCLAGTWLYSLQSRKAPEERPALAALMAMPRIGVALAFVITFRTGESFLGKMKWPFLNTELGIGLGEYAVINGTFGALASFVGTFIGGLLIARNGLRPWFWLFIAAQNVPNLAYAGLAASGLGDPWLVAFVVCIEELGSGFGTAVLMIYLMRLCMKEHKATHFAVLTALMSLSFTLAGSLSGFIADALGYGQYFAFTFAATLPMTVLAFFAPGLRDHSPQLVAR